MKNGNFKPGLNLSVTTKQYFYTIIYHIIKLYFQNCFYSIYITKLV